MPLGIVSDDVFNAEIKLMNRGRGSVKEVPEVIREIIAEDAIAKNGSIQEIASRHGVSSSSVSAYKNGATSTATYHEPDERLARRNNFVRENIITSARSRLLDALQNITSDKLKDAKVRDVASVAKDMSAVIRNTEPQTTPIHNAQFVFHVPRQKDEKDYEFIDVSQ